MYPPDWQPGATTFDGFVWIDHVEASPNNGRSPQWYRGFVVTTGWSPPCLGPIESPLGVRLTPEPRFSSQL